MSVIPPWDHWQSFLAVVDTGSLSGAARRLGLTQPTLSRHVAALEAALGVPLFLRGTQGLVPTPVASALIEGARGMALAEAALRRTAAGARTTDAGVVRLAASEVVGAEVLPPILARFRKLHPAIAVELVLSNRAEDLLRRAADLALRMFRPEQGGLRARRLGTAHLGLYARADHLTQTGGVPQDEASLMTRTLIGPEDIARLGGLTLGGKHPVTGDFGFRCDSDLAQMALVRAGAGIGILQEIVAARDPGLVRVLPGFRPALEVWLAINADMADSRPVRLLADHLAVDVRAAYLTAPA
ncbi:MAG: LysR family transcriptional regulator [Rhodobacterales bacterium]|nr:LysR family transcriptional regulator [Rhodobacterales bacterium]